VRGFVQLRDTGRPAIVYGRPCKEDDLEHEVMVAEVEILLGWRLERGVKVGKTFPDGVAEHRGQRFFLEVDYSGKMTVRKQMPSKWRRYGKIDGLILVVAMTEARMQRLRRHGEIVKGNALFTTFARLRAGQPCLDFKGEEVNI